MEDIIYPLAGLLKNIAWLAAAALVAWFYYRYRTRENEQRQQLMMTALEKGNNTDELMHILQKPRKSARERQLSRLAWGWGLTIMGIILVLLPFIYGIVMVGDMVDWEDVFHDAGPFSFIGAVPLGIGLGFLVAYRAGKRTLKDDD